MPSLRKEAEQLRKKGKTYSEIQSLLKTRIAKSTLSYWCRGIILPKKYHARVQKLNRLHLSEGRKISTANRKIRREAFIEDVDQRSRDLITLFEENIQARKIALTILYLGEGSKTARGSLMFGNSDPATVRMFVGLLRECYIVNEGKFRCTVQCRADQDVKELEGFWSKVTKVPHTQFYKARVDKRTLGQISGKQKYKGVCRIDYFSSAIDLELKRIAEQMLTSFRKGL